MDEIKTKDDKFEYARTHGVCIRCGAKFEPNGHTVCPKCRKTLDEIKEIVRKRL